MLTDTKLKHLKDREKNDKIAGRDGLYLLVTPAGSVTFRYDYRINNRLTIGGMVLEASKQGKCLAEWRAGEQRIETAMKRFLL